MSIFQDQMGNPLQHFGWNVRAGQIPEIFGIAKFGGHTNIDSGVTTTIATWVDTLYSYPSTIEPFGLASPSTNNTSGGSGVQRVNIQGLSSGFVIYSEALTLAGQTPVYTSLPMIRVNRICGLDAGNLEVNDDHIYCGVGSFTAGVPDSAENIYSRIDSGFGQTHQAIYSTPYNYDTYILHFDLDVEKVLDVIGGLYCRTESQSWLVKDFLNARTHVDQFYSIPIKVSPKSDIEIRFRGDGDDDIQVAVRFDLVLNQIT